MMNINSRWHILSLNRRLLFGDFKKVIKIHLSLSKKNIDQWEANGRSQPAPKRWWAQVGCKIFLLLFFYEFEVIQDGGGGKVLWKKCFKIIYLAWQAVGVRFKKGNKKLTSSKTRDSPKTRFRSHSDKTSISCFVVDGRRSTAEQHWAIKPWL